MERPYVYRTCRTKKKWTKRKKSVCLPSVNLQRIPLKNCQNVRNLSACRPVHKGYLTQKLSKREKSVCLLSGPWKDTLIQYRIQIQHSSLYCIRPNKKRRRGYSTHYFPPCLLHLLLKRMAQKECQSMLLGAVSTRGWMDRLIDTVQNLTICVIWYR